MKVVSGVAFALVCTYVMFYSIIKRNDVGSEDPTMKSPLRLVRKS